MKKYLIEDYQNKLKEKFKIINFDKIKIFPKLDPRKTEIILFCDKHGKTKRAWSSLNRHNVFGCKKCIQQNKGLESFLKILKNNNFEFISGEYLTAKSKLNIKCIIHNIVFNINRNDFLEGGGNCSECNKIRWREKYKNNFIKKATKIHKGFYSYEKINYQTTRELVDIICPNHGIFQQSPDSHLQGQKCPKCSISYRENIIKETLEKYKIDYIYNKGHEKLINPKTGYPLKPDFWLEKYNLIIEYDGFQHYKSIYGEKEFNKIQKLDKLKNNLCKENKIKIWRFNKNNINSLESKIIKLIK